jgi:putative DNA primase/helicase
MATESDIVRNLVSAALSDWRNGLRLSEKGKVLECWQNVFVYLEGHPAWQGVLGLDVFAQRIVKRKIPPFERAIVGPWTPEDDLELGLWLAQQDGPDRMVVKAKQTIIDGVSACAMRHKFHPVREFIEHCEPGPQVLIDTWLTLFLGVKPSPYSAAVGRYFLMNMVARVFDPGCIMRSVPVLEGAQERGKSTALHALAQPWFSDSHFDLRAGKDAFEVIQGVLLYEISEMEAFTKAEATMVKQFVSSREDNYRPAYERRAVRVPRQVCFGGTTNDRQYLKDFTGNTRFWPLRCEEVGDIKPDLIAEHRDALFAEARELYRSKARRYPTREDAKQFFEPEQAARRPEHPWMQLVEEWLERPLAGGEKRNRVTITEVLKDGLSVDAARMTAVMHRDVGICLNQLGWERRQGGSTASRARFYERPTQDETEPEAEKGRVPGEDDEPLPI